MCVWETERTGKEVLCSLILNVGRGMTTWEEMDQRFIGPTFRLVCTHATLTVTLPVTVLSSLLHLSWLLSHDRSWCDLHTLECQPCLCVYRKYPDKYKHKLFTSAVLHEAGFWKDAGEEEATERWRSSKSPILLIRRDSSPVDHSWEQRHVLLGAKSRADTPRWKSSEAKRLVMHFPWLTALSHLMFY